MQHKDLLLLLLLLLLIAPATRKRIKDTTFSKKILMVYTVH